MKKNIRFFTLLFVCVMLISGCGTTNTEGNGKNSESEVESESTDDRKNMEAVSENTEVDSETETVDETETTMYAQTEVNVRSIPSADGEKLGTLSTNQEVVALGEAVDGWQKVRYQKKIAYVSAQYLGTEKVEIKTPVVSSKQVDEITADEFNYPALDQNKLTIVIDAGHQGKGNSNKEPDGPGSSTMKAKVSDGATGCVTGIPEYQLTLEVSQKLRDELVARGYQVVMIRETNSFNMSNAERAKVANNIDADAFVRIHADSYSDSSVKGVTTLCQTSSNPYNAQLYAKSYQLSKCILEEFIESTGAKKRRVSEVDNMSGINWCQVPVTIVEMGFLSNPEEDRLMNSDEYQEKMVEGIANGLDAYFGR